jgi:hypothetical protein
MKPALAAGGMQVAEMKFPRELNTLQINPAEG